MIFVPILIVVVMVIAFTPMTPSRRSRRRKPKSFLTMALEGQAPRAGM